MDYGKLIDKQLTKVFKKAGSLLTDAVFHLKNGEGFDFDKRKPISTGQIDKPAKVLVVSTSKKNDVTTKQLLIETISELNAYDSVSLLGQKWSIGQTTMDNGHTQMIEVHNG